MLLQLDLSHNELGAWGKAVLRLGMVKKALGGWAIWLWIGSAIAPHLLLHCCFGNKCAISLPFCCYSVTCFCFGCASVNTCSVKT